MTLTPVSTPTSYASAQAPRFGRKANAEETKDITKLAEKHASSAVKTKDPLFLVWNDATHTPVLRQLQQMWQAIDRFIDSSFRMGSRFKKSKNDKEPAATIIYSKKSEKTSAEDFKAYTDKIEKKLKALVESNDELKKSGTDTGFSLTYQAVKPGDDSALFVLKNVPG